MTRLARLWQGRENWPVILVTLTFALYLVPLPRFNDIGKVGFALLALGGFFYLLFNPKRALDTGPRERFFFIVVLANFIWIATTFYLNGQPGSGYSMVWSRHFYQLFLIPLYYLFRRIEIPDRVVATLIVLGVLLSLGDMLVGMVQGIDYRMDGSNPNGFGPIQLCLSGMLLLFFINTPNDPRRWIALLGCVAGIVTIVLSQSKNTWVTLVVLSVVFALYQFRGRPRWFRLGMLTVIAAVMLGSYQLPVVKSRIDKGIESVARYHASEDYRDESRLGTYGTRMELWKTGWKIFLEHPIVGAGVGNFIILAKQNSERYKVNRMVHGYKYVHNQYIAALATRGIPGLILLLLVLGTPIYIALKHSSRDPGEEVARLSIILICLVYAIGCIAEDHFEVRASPRFMIVMLPLLLARINRQAQPRGCNGG